jgi:hypothetical protein
MTIPDSAASTLLRELYARTLCGIVACELCHVQKLIPDRKIKISIIENNINI